MITKKMPEAPPRDRTFSAKGTAETGAPRVGFSLQRNTISIA